MRLLIRYSMQNSVAADRKQLRILEEIRNPSDGSTNPESVSLDAEAIAGIHRQKCIHISCGHHLARVHGRFHWGHSRRRAAPRVPAVYAALSFGKPPP